MDIHEAVRIAKDYCLDVFESENVYHLGLEEIVYDEITDSWNVTIGFTRIWQDENRQPVQKRSTVGELFGVTNRADTREFKLVEIGASDGKVKSLTIRKV